VKLTGNIYQLMTRTIHGVELCCLTRTPWQRLTVGRGLDLKALQEETWAADQRIEGGGMKDLGRLPLY
jgi:hypothetical protein